MCRGVVLASVIQDGTKEQHEITVGTSSYCGEQTNAVVETGQRVRKAISPRTRAEPGRLVLVARLSGRVLSIDDHCVHTDGSDTDRISARSESNDGYQLRGVRGGHRVSERVRGAVSD